MTSGAVGVIGSSTAAAQWATRYLASGFDVVVTDPALVAAVEAAWPSAERLGLFPGAALARLVVLADGTWPAVEFVHVVDEHAPLREQPETAVVVSDADVRGCEPVHLLPLVELGAGPHRELLRRIYASMGMAPVDAESPAEERARLGPAIAAVAGDDPDAIVAVLRALRPSGIGAGASVAAHEAARLTAAAIPRWRPGDTVPAPLALYRTPVEPDWVDYNGHMTEAAYLTAAGWASDALFRYVGDDEAYRAAGHSFYTVETHVHYVREVALHEPIEFTTQVLGADAKRLHLVHLMFHGADGGLLCSVEQMLLHVDMHAGRSAAMLPDVAAAVRAIAESHALLPVPPQVGSVMRLPHRPAS